MLERGRLDFGSTMSHLMSVDWSKLGRCCYSPFTGLRFSFHRVTRILALGVPRCLMVCTDGRVCINTHLQFPIIANPLFDQHHARATSEPLELTERDILSPTCALGNSPISQGVGTIAGTSQVLVRPLKIIEPLPATRTTAVHASKVRT
jgi:hypothetical protein